MPAPSVAVVGTTGGVHGSSGPIRSICWRSRTATSEPSRSALFTTKTSAISKIPAFATWTASPQPGETTTTVVSVAAATSTSACPTPTVSTITRS